MCHLPEVRDDAFDITYRAMPVCRMQTGGARPVTSILRAGIGHNQGLLVLTMSAPGNASAKRSWHNFDHYICKRTFIEKFKSFPI